MEVYNEYSSPVNLIDEGTVDLQKQLLNWDQEDLTREWYNPYTETYMSAMLFALFIGHIEAVQILVMLLPPSYITSQWEQWEHQRNQSFYLSVIMKLEQKIVDAKQALELGNDWFVTDLEWLNIPKFWLMQLWQIIGRNSSILFNISHPNMIFQIDVWQNENKKVDALDHQLPQLYEHDGLIQGKFVSSILSDDFNADTLRQIEVPVVFFRRSFDFAVSHLVHQWKVWRELTVEDRWLFVKMIRTLLLGDVGPVTYMHLEHDWSRWWFDRTGHLVPLSFESCLSSVSEHDRFQKDLITDYDQIKLRTEGVVSLDEHAKDWIKKIRSCASVVMNQPADDHSTFRHVVKWHSRFKDQEHDGVFLIPFEIDEFGDFINNMMS